ncbi:related to SSO1-syntaxin-related protein [Serendipita indica DSM 11827]|uniref:Related to SSO1-syntaxin-related protein n=1 Tax=Serendipita indica (strain DSM 11827) TaxID=1109443 RepID=G4TD38_SERID|nr:related to SSO1-syntaxin-related protein [Serendipita indica DSM 11827]
MSRTNGVNTGLPNITDMPSFLIAVEQLEEELIVLNANINTISQLQERSLNNIGDNRVQSDLDSLVRETKAMAQGLRTRIKEMESLRSNSREGQIRKRRVEILKEKFLQAMQNYRQAEQRFQSAQKAQIERQVRTVKPSATNEEIQAIVNDTSNGQVFQQALMNSDQLGKAKTAYRNVQTRHEELLRITQTMAELTQMMNDMALMVEQDQEKIAQIEKNTAAVEADTEKALNETRKARTWAEKAREKRKMCFIISVIILLIIAIALAIVFGRPQKN